MGTEWPLGRQFREGRTCNDNKAMKRSLALLVAIISLVVAETPHAALIVHEPFDYPVGNLTNQNGGTGWPAAWTNAGNGTVVSPGLIYDDVWNRLISSSNACGMNTVANTRDLPATYGSAGQTIYVSFIGRVDSAFLAGLTLNQGDSQRCVFGRVTQPTWQVSDLSGVVIDSGLSSTQTSLIVVRLDFAVSTVNIRLHVNPPLAAEPGVPTGSVTRPTFSFNRIRVWGTGANVRLIDEIRLGTTWADVTPHAPSPLQLFVSGVSLPEGNSDTTDFVFNVGLNRTNDQSVTVDFLTANGTALAGSDYVATNGSLTFNPGETNKTVAVRVNGDATVEYDETFRLVLTNSVNAGISSLSGAGTGTILDDDFVMPVLFAEEQFRYPNGSPMSGLNGGIGWSNTWIGSFGGAAVTAPGLTHAAGAQTLAVSSNAASLSGSFVAQSRPVRDLERVKDGTLYVSFLGRVDSGQVALTLNQSGVPRFSIGRNGFSANWNVSHPLGEWSVVSAVPATAQSLLVVRVDYAGANMTLRLYVNPTLSAEPAAVGQTNLPAARFDSIALSTSGFSGGVAVFDEIRVATTWAAAVPLGALPLPNINLSDATVVEGDSSATNLVFNVSLSRTNNQAVTVNFGTTNGTATAGSDYTATNGVLTFAAGETKKSVTVTVSGDADPEADETVRLVLTNAANAAIADGIGVGRILDNDTPPGIVVFGGRTFEGNSGDTFAVFEVLLSRAWKQTVTVSYLATNGTATVGSDYEPASGTLTFNPGEIEKQVPVRVHGDLVEEPNETLLLRLTNAINAAIVGGGGVGVIGNDDGADPIGTITTVVATDDPVPGETNRVFKQFIGTPTLNDFGEILFVASTAFPDGSDPERGLWLTDGQTFTKIASEKMAAPGYPAGWTYSGDFANATINDDGTVLFVGGANAPPAPRVEGSVSAQGIFPDADRTGVFVGRGFPGAEYVFLVWLLTGDGSLFEDVAANFESVTGIHGLSTAFSRPLLNRHKAFVGVEYANDTKSAVLNYDLPRTFTGGSGANPKVLAQSGQKVPKKNQPQVFLDLHQTTVGGTDEQDGWFLYARTVGQNSPNTAAVLRSDASGGLVVEVHEGHVFGGRIAAGVYPIIGSKLLPGGVLRTIIDYLTFTPPLNELWEITDQGSVLVFTPETVPLPALNLLEGFLGANFRRTLVSQTEKGLGAVDAEGSFQKAAKEGDTVMNLGGSPQAVTSVNRSSASLTRNDVATVLVQARQAAGPTNSAVLAQDGTNAPAIVASVSGSLMASPTAEGGPPNANNQNKVVVREGPAGQGDPSVASAGKVETVTVSTGTKTKPIIRFAGGNRATEGQAIQLTLWREGDLSEPSGVTVWLQNGSAKRLSDFMATPEGDPVFVTFGPGEFVKTVSLLIVDDAEPEYEERFYAYLTHFVNADPGIYSRNAEVWITDDQGRPSDRLEFLPWGPIDTNRFGLPYTTLGGTGFVQRAQSLAGPFQNLPGAGNPMILAIETADDAVHYISDLGIDSFFRLGGSVLTGTIGGTVSNPDGTPWSGIVSIGDSDQVTGTDAQGNFQIENVPAGEVPLSFWVIYSVTNSASGQVEHSPVRITVFVTLVPGQEAVVEAKVELPQEEEEPACNCVPWCGIVGGTFGGVQKVVAGGGKRGDCTDNPTVTVTGPSGINHPIRGKPRTYTPAANGTWTVTATICGVTKQCEITLP